MIINYKKIVHFDINQTLLTLFIKVKVLEGHYYD